MTHGAGAPVSAAAGAATLSPTGARGPDPAEGEARVEAGREPGPAGAAGATTPSVSTPARGSTQASRTGALLSSEGYARAREA